MKRKTFFKTALGAVAALLGGLVSSPSGQQLAEQAMNTQEGTTVQQQAPAQNRLVNQGQQAQSRMPGQTVRSFLNNPYAPGGGAYYAGAYGMSPKEYGEYLMRTGKDKQNLRKRKHYAKMHS